MTRVPHGYIQHGQHAQWAPSTDNTDHTLSNSSVAENVSASVTKSTEEEQRQEEKNLIWSMIHDQSGRDIVRMVKAGTQVGSVSFAQWKQSVEQDLKFGPRITTEQPTRRLTVPTVRPEIGSSKRS